MEPEAATRWTVVVPVKDRRRAKSRLAAAYPGSREALAVAFALDTLDAVTRVATVDRVVVVTDDPFLVAVPPTGVEVVPDPSGGADLDLAVRTGIAAAGDGAVAVVFGDLPSLRSDELAAALDEASVHRCAVVPDADGTGTTMLSALVAADLRPAYGPGSASRHAVGGATVLHDDGRWPGLRRDVDEPAHVDGLLRDGTGPRTTALLRELSRRAG